MEWKQLISNQRYPAYKSDDQQELTSVFSSDYRRIVKSAAFRRLQDKTQVFPLDRSDFVRTRLTHSLEVAMLSRDLLQTVIHKLNSKGIDTNVLSEAYRLLECASLIHDIGNPPFGHFGEEAIRIWFQENMDRYPILKNLCNTHQQEFLHFEGNAQSLRILTKIHDYNGSTMQGMRLSASVVDTIIKYVGNAEEMDKNNLKYKKIGYFDSEYEVFHKIKTLTGTTGTRHPLVYLLEAADDISYTFSDLEDGFHYGMFSIADLEAYLNASISNDDSLSQEAIMQKFIRETQAKVYQQASCNFVNNYDAIMQGIFPNDLFDESNDCMKQFLKLKSFCFDYIFEHDSIIKLEITSYRIMKGLLDTFIPLVLNKDNLNEFETKLFRFIPKHALQLFEVESYGKKDEEILYYKVKIALDFICGMSDGYAKKLYNELFQVNV